MANSDLNQTEIEIQSNQINPKVSELSVQLAQLNAKLVKSFERIADLEDELHDLTVKHDQVKSRNQVLELEANQHEEALKGGLLVESANVQAELQRLTQRALQEAEKRSQSEASLSTINKELDDLSASLFSEANKLVANEKLQRIKSERKVIEVEEAMKRVEELIESRRDQLNDLRNSLEDAERERDEYKSKLFASFQTLDSNEIDNSSISDGILISDQKLSIKSSNPTLAINSPTDAVISPNLNLDFRGSITSGLKSPSFFQQQQQQNPKVMEDILPFQEFLQFTKYLIRTRTDLLSRPTNQPLSFGESYSVVINNISPSTPINKESPTPTSVSPNELLTPALTLSQHLSQPFLKRCIEEDSDPTLRLDLAPGLNFLSRRGIFTSLIEGNLVIEPVWSENEFEKCSMCGCSLNKWLPDRRRNDTSIANDGSASSTMRKMLGGATSWSFSTLNRSNKRPSISSSTFIPRPSSLSANVLRNISLPITPSGRHSPTNREEEQEEEEEAIYVHTFRVTDTSVNRYPICPTYCLARLRSVCDLWTYLRSISRGLLLDDHSKFVNRPIGSSKDRQGLGMAYDSKLRLFKQQQNAQHSLESVIDQSSEIHNTNSVPSVKSSPQAKINSPSPLNDSTSTTDSITNQITSNEHLSNEKSVNEQRSPSPNLITHTKTLSLNAPPPPIPHHSPTRSRSIPLFQSSHSTDSLQISSHRTSIIEEDDNDNWEERCWIQLVKLKKQMFYKRVGISSSSI
ncbi:hypothetical protein CROQUDRAFT_724913 [Cronartium quercuum f. sp. fusiforme G11]|uniref:GDP/GTP exchange factor Sec2 N-terminal domain-containing protein n=1 Tax=Cronartium quercuum f. sp. fusiforme G11 TaxID=708437 RepID=A0A9P6NA64_9BASI|nr:hypothetical protein CROQUDRAFT_724913 [Cronartium quercuum f. sp. fusiforme G11]